MCAALACSGTDETTGPVRPVVTIVTNIVGMLFGGDSLHAIATAVNPAGALVPGRVVSLSALTPDIATITSTGVIHGHGEGIAQFLAVSGYVSDTIGLRVFALHVGRITATPDSLTLVVGRESGPIRFHVFDTADSEMEGVSIALYSSEPTAVLADSYFHTATGIRVGDAVLSGRADTAFVSIYVTVVPAP